MYQSNEGLTNKTMEIKKLEGLVEAILFASGEAVSVDRIAELIGHDKATTLKIIQSLGNRLDDIGSAVEMKRLGESYQLCTRAEYGEIIKTALDIRRNTPLSQAALEVLAIVAYNQPVTKSFIEQVRGVDSSGVVSNLLEKELLEEAGRMDIPGRPISYQTTANFLRCFGLSSLEKLPPLPERLAVSAVSQEEDSTAQTF